VTIWLRVGDELHPEASSDGNLREGPLRVDGQALPPLPGDGISVPVVHQGELLGAISITMPKDEPLRPAGEQLVTDVASQAGLALANAGLIEDLRASRQRLVTAQDEARRRLERNIHDGAQQDLVALAIKLQLAETSRRRRSGPDRAGLRRAQDRRRRSAGKPARPRPRDLPAAAGRPRPCRRAQRAGQQVAAAGDG
jgi:GAF domain-containing protein